MMPTTPKAGDFDSVVTWLEERLATAPDHVAEDICAEARAFGISGIVVARAFRHHELNGNASGARIARAGKVALRWRRVSRG